MYRANSYFQFIDGCIKGRYVNISLFGLGSIQLQNTAAVTGKPQQRSSLVGSNFTPLFIKLQGFFLGPLMIARSTTASYPLHLKARDFGTRTELTDHQQPKKASGNCFKVYIGIKMKREEEKKIISQSNVIQDTRVSRARNSRVLFRRHPMRL
jgi:hypothetical protein